MVRLVKIVVFSTVFLQKLAIHVGESDVQLILPIMIGCAGLAIWFGQVKVDIPRSIALLAFVAFAIVSQMLSERPFSGPSIILIFIMYPLLCLRSEVRPEAQLAVVSYFQTCMVIIGVLTLFLQLVQYTIGPRYWPNLDQILPPGILYRGYNYLQPLSYGSQYFKPNAIFMLEVSFVQQLSALALLIEFAYFRRALVLALLSIVVLITFAGSGLLILLFAAPVLLLVLPIRVAMLAVVGVATAFILLTSLGWFEIVSSRMSEFTTVNTSGYFRFTLPVLTFIANLGNPDFLFTGNGAGSTLKGTSYLLLPFAKLMSEYGFTATLTFYVFLCLSLFKGSPNRFAAYAAFLQYNIGGSTLAIPLNVAIFFALGTFLKVDREELWARLKMVRGW